MFTPYDLRMVRGVHVARLANRRRFDSRTGDAIGAPGTLVSLGSFLVAAGLTIEQSDAEEWFGLDYAYYADLATVPEVIDEGERFACVILDELRAGGDALSVRCPVRRIERPAMRRAA